MITGQERNSKTIEDSDHKGPRLIQGLSVIWVHTQAGIQGARRVESK